MLCFVLYAFKSLYLSFVIAISKLYTFFVFVLNENHTVPLEGPRHFLIVRLYLVRLPPVPLLEITGVLINIEV